MDPTEQAVSESSSPLSDAEKVKVDLDHIIYIITNVENFGIKWYLCYVLLFLDQIKTSGKASTK